ncbi:hypothetical protein IV203_022422 [Nitzschia inconspicua]|uniref:Uncharacterized protein n=1 Tax=Nitzschia inconspicua TaxID=303405 RepID=A0A9K3PGT2_9STRA|nr:hypothetical protein IV203_022422 [Nitzschia inconspicua]
MNRQSTSMEDAVQGGASSDPSDVRNRGELRKNSPTVGVSAFSASTESSCIASKEAARKGSTSSAVEQEQKRAGDGNDDNVKTGQSTIQKKRSRIRLRDVEDEYPEFVEKTRAMSRLYSQRNRDKQKKQIEELQAWKDKLEEEQYDLLRTRKDYKQRLSTTEEENEALRKQLIEQRERDVRLLEQRNLVHMQHLKEELLLTETAGRSLIGQPGGGMGSRMTGGFVTGRMGSHVDSIGMHQSTMQPLVAGISTADRWPSSHRQLAASSHPHASMARHLPEYYPPNTMRPYPVNDMIRASNITATTPAMRKRCLPYVDEG